MAQTGTLFGQPKLEDAIASTSNPKEAKALLQALLTPAELNNVEQRWDAFLLLLEGATHRKVRDVLGTSISTATRAAQVVRAHRPLLVKAIEKSKTKKEISKIKGGRPL
jgi:uncharacterized protein YerC